MECGFIRENLFAITEKQLPPEVLARAEAHLETCGGCKAMAEFLVLAERGVSAMKQAEPDPFTATRTLALLESRFPNPDHSIRYRARILLQPALITLFLGFAVVAGILFGSYGYRQHDQAAAASETEMLKTELSLEEAVFEEPGLLMME